MTRQYFVELFNYDEMKENKCRGIVMGPDITDMVRKLEEYYATGNTRISSLVLTQISNKGGLIETESY